MNQYDEQAERRKLRAEKITQRTKDNLVNMLIEYHKKFGRKRIAQGELDFFLVDLVEKYEKRIVSYIREQLTSDDR